MDCTITSTTARSNAGRRGFTLVESVVATGIGAIVVGAIMTYWMFAARSFQAMGNYLILDANSRNALDVMSHDIRQADSCSTNGFSSTNLTILMTDPTSGANFTINYSYDANAGTLIRTDTDPNNTSTTMLLTNCLSFAFTYYQRNPVGGAWEAFPIDSDQAGECKLVQMDWTCKRLVYGNMLVNSETTESAKVVIRKE